jgi:hypothetical protein
MSSSQLPTSAIPKPLPDDDDDVSWALQTAAVQWGRGAYEDAIVWLRRAAESAIELSAWSRAADLNATASRLEKQIARHLPQPASPLPPSNFPSSAPPRNAVLPSYPVGPTSAPPALGIGSLAGSRRQTAGYSSFPPIPSKVPSSQPRPSGDRSSVVIDVEEDELELSEDELRELESNGMLGSDVPNGADRSRAAPPPSRHPPRTAASSESLPAFALESSPPSSGIPRRSSPAAGVGQLGAAPESTSTQRALPSFPLESAAREPPTGPQSLPSSAIQGRSAGRRPSSELSGPPDLPSFPLDGGVSSVPPVSQWPQFGSPGTSRLPPNPALPSFESSIPPSRPFVDDDDDGAPGVEQVLDEQVPDPHLLKELSERPRGRRPMQKPAAADTELPTLPDLEEINAPGESAPAGFAEDLARDDGERPPSVRGGGAPPSPLGHLSVRAGRASKRPRPPSASLPPALPEGRSKLPKLPVAPRRRPSGEAPPLPRETRPPPPSPPTESRATPPPSSVSVAPVPLPSRPSTHSIEPRMPNRTISYGSPLDLSGKVESQSAADRRGSIRPSRDASPSPPGSRVTSTMPTLRRQEPASALPPPSARSINPEDLPTVSSPSLSRPPPETRAREPGEAASERPKPIGRRGEGHESAPPLPERRRLSFRFEEPKTQDQKPNLASPKPSVAQVETLTVSEHSELSASSLAHVLPETVPEEPLAVLPPVTTRPAQESKEQRSDDVVLAGVRLADVRGFSDLPASAHRMLAKTARIETLSTGEEASFFSVALVLDGWVGLMPAIADSACATAVVGEVVFTEGSLADGVMLRVVAGQDDVVVATWDSESIGEATKDCPWIAEDLRLLADGFQALAGACLGPLGDRLDDSLRSIVTSRCEIRTLLPGEQLCAANKPVPGMHIVGGGEVELVDENGRVTKTYGIGEFLFAPQVLAGGVVPFAARASNKGALVLFAPRMAAHELLVSVPPLLEILAE